ncbi:MAG TPA: FadR/GntR family transcriptional regulator [Acidimicrobiales bacterium]|nr:FadR/GntR family transcriptional regulator [Acidimicrobiales bacterium]
MTSEHGRPESLRRLPLYQQLQSSICDYIFENALRPGDPLPPEGELAELFGVSRNSLREAVKSLQVLGVLDSRAGSGLFVREFSFDPIVERLPYAILVDHRDLSDLLDVRRILEVGMAGRVIELRTQSQVQRLHELIEEWRGALARDRTAYPAHLDRAFHEVLVGEAQNELVGKLLDMFWQVFNRASALEQLVAPRSPSATFKVHIPILEAMARGDESALCASLLAHYEGINRRVMAAAGRSAASSRRAGRPHRRGGEGATSQPTG